MAIRRARMPVFVVWLAIAAGCSPSDPVPSDRVTSESHATHQTPAPVAPGGASSDAVRVNTTVAPGLPPKSMAWIPGGTFWMGCEGCGMPDAVPVHLVEVDGFWMDRTPVTNAEFERFVAETRLRHRRRASTRSEGFSRRAEGHARVRARPSSRPHRSLCRSTIRCGGGATRRAQAGSAPRAPAAISAIAPIIRSFTSRSKMRPRMPSGPASACRPKPNSSSPRAAASIGICIRGATS